MTFVDWNEHYHKSSDNFWKFSKWRFLGCLGINILTVVLWFGIMLQFHPWAVIPIFVVSVIILAIVRGDNCSSIFNLVDSIASYANNEVNFLKNQDDWRHKYNKVKSVKYDFN